MDQRSRDGPEADTAPQAPSGPLAGVANSVLPFVLMFAVIYLLLVRPANKQRKEHAELLGALKKDDEVVTSSGMVGRIASLDDKIATLELADKVKIRILRDRIAGRWTPGNAATGQIGGSTPKGLPPRRGRDGGQSPRLALSGQRPPWQRSTGRRLSSSVSRLDRAMNPAMQRRFCPKSRSEKDLACAFQASGQRKAEPSAVAPMG